MLKVLKSRFDAWNNRHFDKVEHALVGFGLCSSFGLWGIAAVMAAETLKELLLDASFDWKDWLWTLGGAVIGFAFGAL